MADDLTPQKLKDMIKIVEGPRVSWKDEYLHINGLSAHAFMEREQFMNRFTRSSQGPVVDASYEVVQDTINENLSTVIEPKLIEAPKPLSAANLPDFVAPEYPHASDCAIWVNEPCNCIIGRPDGI